MKQEQLINEMIYNYRTEHKAVYQAYDKTKVISIVYTGIEATATAEVKANSLELAAPAASVVLTIDLSAGPPPKADILSEVVDAINTFGTGFAAVLGDQFDGDEASASLTIAGPTSVKTTAVWFAFDANISNKIKITIPTVVVGKKVTLTKVLGSVTGTGASTFEFTKDSTLVWLETAGTTGVEKVSTLPSLDSNVGEQLILRLKMASTLTAGYLTVAYDEKQADAIPLFV
jgi:hypothetical protein